MLIAEIKASRLQLSRRRAPLTTRRPRSSAVSPRTTTSWWRAGTVHRSDLSPPTWSRSPLERLRASSCHFVHSKDRIQVTDVLVQRGDFLSSERLRGDSRRGFPKRLLDSLLRSAQYDSELAEAVARQGPTSRSYLPRSAVAARTEVGRLRRRAKARQGTQARTEYESNPCRRRRGRSRTGNAARFFHRANQIRGDGQCRPELTTKLAEIAQSRAYCDTVAPCPSLRGVGRCGRSADDRGPAGIRS